MKTPYKVAALATVLGLIAFFFESNMPLGWILWAPAPENPAPTSLQVAFFILLGVTEAVTFGLGVAFLIFGYPLVKAVPMSPAWSVITFVAIGWLLVNWLPHDSLHNHIGPSLDKLLAVEYGFHVTLMIAGMIVALFFVRMAVMLGTERKTTTATRAARLAEPVTR